MKAYLDIETSFRGEITVIGIFHPPSNLVQLVGDEIHRTNLLNALDPASIIVTYNGNRFDLPVIRKRIGIDLRRSYESRDLMYECWRQNLRGGLKRVEESLGIDRRFKELDGFDAMRLWETYVRDGDPRALETLLLYNQDDTVNLVHLEEALEERSLRSLRDSLSPFR